MQNDPMNAIRARFEFEDWRGRSRSKRALDLRDVRLPDDVVPDLAPGPVRALDPGDGSRLFRMRWTGSGERTSIVLVDLRVCASIEAAHDALLDLLASMQAPDVRRLAEAPFGDVAFAHDRTSVIAFARSNVVVAIANGGERKVPADRVAESIDRWIADQE